MVIDSQQMVILEGWKNDLCPYQIAIRNSIIYLNKIAEHQNMNS